jgi:hypothetical protein
MFEPRTNKKYERFESMYQKIKSLRCRQYHLELSFILLRYEFKYRRLGKDNVDANFDNKEFNDLEDEDYDQDDEEYFTSEDDYVDENAGLKVR